MKLLFKIIFVLAAGLYVSYRIIREVDHEVIFRDVINFSFAAITVVFFAIMVFNDLEEYKESRKIVLLIPAAVGLFIAIGLLVTLAVLRQRDKSPTRLYCVTKASDFNGVSISFRQDGTYKLTDWGLGADYYRGTYTIKDSIIILDKTAVENVLQSNRLLIRQDSTGKGERSIYQVDGSGRVIERAMGFRVVESSKK